MKPSNEFQNIVSREYRDWTFCYINVQLVKVQTLPIMMLHMTFLMIAEKPGVTPRILIRVESSFFKVSSFSRECGIRVTVEPLSRIPEDLIVKIFDLNSTSHTGD